MTTRGTHRTVVGLVGAFVTIVEIGFGLLWLWWQWLRFVNGASGHLPWFAVGVGGGLSAGSFPFRLAARDVFDPGASFQVS